MSAAAPLTAEAEARPNPWAPRWRRGRQRRTSPTWVPVAANALLPFGEWDQIAPVTPEMRHALGPRGFALRCYGMSLFFRGILDGGLVYVNPDHEPVPGQVVMAHAVAADGTTYPVCKVWMTDGAEQWLQSEGAGRGGEQYAGNGRVALHSFAVVGVVLYEAAGTPTPGWWHLGTGEPWPVRPYPPRQAAANCERYLPLAISDRLAERGHDPAALRREASRLLEEYDEAVRNGNTDGQRAARVAYQSFLERLQLLGGIRAHRAAAAGALVEAEG